MPIKKTKLSHKSKKLMKKILSRKKTQKNKKMHSKNQSKNHSKNRSNYKKSNSLKMRRRNMRNIHSGGFASSSCNMATIKEPGFSIDALGAIPGINIPGSRAAIYRPNCNKNMSSQAMTP